MQIEPNPMDKTNSDGEKSTGNVPAFLLKVWTLVEDPSTDELIYWDPSGTSFHVYDQQRFSREILPLYFKHSNIASFIRQLNMYGFRKVAHIDQGSLKIENDDVHFQHPYFQRGAKDYLQYIKRKVSNQTLRADSLTAVKNDEVSRVLTDVTQMKSKQEDMDTNLEYIKRENKLLWREVASLRQKHHKQQEIVNKLIQFLVSLVSSNRAGLTIPALRRAPLAIDSNQMPTTAPMSSGRPDVSQQIMSANTSSNYTIESPKSDFRPNTPNLGTGPIIHELTEVLDAPEQCVGFSDSRALSGRRIEDESQVQDIIALPNFDSSRSSIGDTPVVSIQQVTSPESPSSTPIKIPTAPSLQDALNYAWTTPNPLPDSQLAGHHDADGNKALSSQLAQRKKSRQSSSSEDEPPIKKRVPSQPMSFASMGGLTTPVIGSDDQANSTFEDLVMSSSSLDKVRGTGSREDVSLALPAFNTGDDITLNNSSQLDFLNSDLDGLRGLLQEQYKIDPSVLIDLFESSNPWAIIPEKSMEGLLSGDRDNEPGTSSLDCSNGDITATGTELVQYNPKELFPELLDDGVIDDIDDLD